MRDLCDLMENGSEYRDGCYEDDGIIMSDDIQEQTFNSRTFGMALTFGDMLAEEEAEALLNALDSQDPADIFETMEANKEERISLKSRNAALVPAFEKYVYERCGIKR